MTPVRRALLCLSPQVVVGITDGPEQEGQRVKLAFADFQPAPLRATPFQLLFDHEWEVIRDSREGYGPYRVSSRQYRYHILNSERQPLFMFHWHPEAGPARPHLHAAALHPGMSDRYHIPSGRVAIEEIVRFAIEEVGAHPAREDWRDVIAQSDELHRMFRSWS